MGDPVALPILMFVLSFIIESALPFAEGRAFPDVRLVLDWSIGASKNLGTFSHLNSWGANLLVGDCEFMLVVDIKYTKSMKELNYTKEINDNSTTPLFFLM